MYKPCLAASRQSTDEKICIFIEHFCVWRLFLCFSSHFFPLMRYFTYNFQWGHENHSYWKWWTTVKCMPKCRERGTKERLSWREKMKILFTNEKFLTWANRSQLQASSLKIYMQCEKQKELTLNFLSQQLQKKFLQPRENLMRIFLDLKLNWI